MAGCAQPKPPSSLGFAHARSGLSLAPWTSSTGVGLLPVSQPGARYSRKRLDLGRATLPKKVRRWPSWSPRPSGGYASGAKPGSLSFQRSTRTQPFAIPVVKVASSVLDAVAAAGTAGVPATATTVSASASPSAVRVVRDLVGVHRFATGLTTS
jgi:hypothetical protein